MRIIICPAWHPKEREAFLDEFEGAGETDLVPGWQVVCGLCPLAVSCGQILMKGFLRFEWQGVCVGFSFYRGEHGFKIDADVGCGFLCQRGAFCFRAGDAGASAFGTEVS